MPPPRTSLRLLLCLILGFLTTLLIAWGLILEPDRRFTTPLMGTDYSEPRPPEQLPIQTMHWRRFGSDEWAATREGMLWDFPPARGELPLPEGIVPEWARTDLLPWKPADPPEPHGRRIFAYGWPCRALWCSLELTPHPTGAWPYIARDGITLCDPAPFNAPSTFAPRPLVLPTRILYRGLLADTAAYSAVWSLVLFAPGIARRTLRRRRGQCPRCAYDLAGLAPDSPCPECGNAAKLAAGSSRRAGRG